MATWGDTPIGTILELIDNCRSIDWCHRDAPVPVAAAMEYVKSKHAPPGSVWGGYFLDLPDALNEYVDFAVRVKAKIHCSNCWSRPEQHGLENIKGLSLDLFGLPRPTPNAP
jgi:hypothetical protein